VVLIVEPLDPEVMQWLVSRHAVRYAPDLARDPRALRQALRPVRALVIPPTVALDVDTLAQAPTLQAVGRLSGGIENIDFEACARAGVEVVRPTDATAPAEAEFVIGALLQLLRRVPVVNNEGSLVGRELGGATVGLIGLNPTAQLLAQLLHAFGARVIGYDPQKHASDPLWERWAIAPVTLRELMAESDGVAVLLGYFSRYHGLLAERHLALCKPNQVLVSLSPSGLFDTAALADVLATGRMAAAWMDSVDAGEMLPGQPLQQLDTLQISPRVASTTRESRIRAAWDVARRIDTLLSPPPDLRPRPDAPPGLADD
jgi:phosphoglycerate dehydrogenase-like enzyme